MEQEKISNYHILGEIASGAQGTVYRAWDAAIGRMVALKELRSDGLFGGDDDVQRFHREAMLASRIDHPNVVCVYESFEYDGNHYIAMELLSTSVHDLIQAAGKLPMARAVDIFRQAALGLEAALEQGIIHRDIKPQNLLLASDGTVKVSDFGIARASDLNTITNAGTVMGTCYYMSPEQAKGLRADTRSDIYSLGVTFYEMLTGKVPFSEGTAYEIMRQHVEETPVPVRSIRREATRPGILAMLCLEKDPDKRPQRPKFLADMLAFPFISEWAALVALYEATDGDNWTDSDNWLTDAPLGEWFGIQTDDDGRVTVIDFNSCNELHGPLPRELGNLTNLILLRFCDFNLITGELPSELSNLVNLQSLVFLDSQLSGRIPPWLGSLTELGDLTLVWCQLVGEIPPELGNLTNLEFLSLSGNNLTGKIPPELGNLTNLRVLDLLEGNDLEGELPPALRGLPGQFKYWYC